MNKVYKFVLAATAATIVASTSILPSAVIAWGDSANGRPAYTLAEINAGKLGNKITFNSISNGKIGHEFNFVGAKLSSSTSNTWKADEIKVKDGEVYTIRLYVHNNSPLGTAAIAQNVTTSFSLPTTVAKSQDIIGYINSSNAAPERYWDEVRLTSDNDFYIEYVAGSAKWTNSKLGTVKLADEVITSGVKVGYEALNGQIPGCYDYDGQVTIQVKVHESVASKLELTVRKKGETDWKESVNAKVGDEVEYRIEYINLASATAKNVMIRDVLPNDIEYVKGSTVLYNASHQSGVKITDDTLTTDGINIGTYKAHGNAYVTFTGKVVDKTLKDGDNQLVNWASSTVNKVVSKDDASVMVKKEKKEDPVEGIKLNVTVRRKGETDWKESVNAKVGEEVEYRIEYVNTGTAVAKNVIITDTLPTNVQYVKNTTVLYNASNKNGKKVTENTLTTTGINIGDYKANGNAYVTFTAKIVDKSLKAGDNKLVNWANATTASKLSAKDDATVMVKKNNGEEPTPPVIPSTGASDVAGAALGAGSLITAAGYFIASRKKKM